MKHHLEKISLLVLAVVFFSGCEDGKPPTPAEVFKETQVGTNTPHGPVVPGSAVATPDGNVRYSTEGGGTWEATPQPAQEGGHTYVNARKVDPDDAE